MFLEETSTYVVTVKVRVPDPDRPDKGREQTFVARFETLPRDELDQLVKNERPVSELLDRVLQKVEGIQDRDGNELEQSKALALVKANMFTSTACRDAFWDSINKARKS